MISKKYINCNEITEIQKMLLFLLVGYAQNSYLINYITENMVKFQSLMSNACPNQKCVIDYYGKEGVQEYIAGRCNNIAIISLSGTDNLFGKQFFEALGEWKQNLTAIPVYIEGTNFQVHKGFLDMALPVYNDILNLVRYYKSQYPNIKIVLTGHSRGGATCQVVAFLLKLRDNIVVDSLITYGAPQPFYGKEIIEYLQPYFFDKTVHVEAKYDPATTLFGGIFSNTCPSRTLLIESYSILPVAHGINNYIYGLNLKFGCITKNNVCGCPKNLKEVPLIPGGGTTYKYKELSQGTCPYY